MILLEMLEDVAIVEGLAPEYLRLLATEAHLHELPEGAVLFQEGTPSAFIYIVLLGSVDLEVRLPDGSPFVVQTVGPGELLGWTPVLGGGPMTATARTRTRCRLAALSGHRLLELCEQHPRFGAEFFRRTAAALAGRLHATRLKLLTQKP